MKKYTLLFLMLPLLSTAQQVKHGYFSLRGGASMKGDQMKGIVSISVGASNNSAFGIGAGIGYINFEKPYLPLTIDMSFFGKPGKLSPVVIGQAGYGVYNYTAAYIVSRGGFTGSLSAGLAVPVNRKDKFIFTIGYYTYNFISTTRYPGAGIKKIGSNENRIAVTVGFKI